MHGLDLPAFFNLLSKISLARMLSPPPPTSCQGVEKNEYVHACCYVIFYSN